MSESDFGRGRGAMCPLHPDHLAQRTCTRCGNFMCDTCSEGGTQVHCPTCREREGLGQAFPLDRHNWSVGGLLEVCWERFKREWVMLSVGAILFFAAAMVGSFVSQILSFIGGLSGSTTVTVLMVIVGTVLSWVIQGMGTLGITRMCLDVLQGQRADLGRMFSQLSKLVPYLLTLLLSFAVMLPVIILCFGAALAVFVGMSGVSLAEVGSSEEAINAVISNTPPHVLVVAFVVGAGLYIFPGLWLVMPLVLMQPALVDAENPGPVETLKRCFAAAQGQRLGMLGTLFIGAVIFIVGIFLCCLPGIPALAFFQLLLAGLYLSLSKGAEEV
ncbi:hypothetical protein HUA74_28460 [Myxococcus sp. CA051A]|uniref:hypothetical protein n=1 Tax=unclassified Myxococcus TaxID=2648731 RepID=UPI00157AA9C0|nr:MULTISPECIES: hypothetical protein [unclassified Myxococcus]NTX10123.1 hypothetical protein [Myxococcus sp. CA056]NTX64587.1 hypothetical protein [Myxococcus sp. CA051A]